MPFPYAYCLFPTLYDTARLCSLPLHTLQSPRPGLADTFDPEAQPSQLGRVDHVPPVEYIHGLPHDPGDVTPVQASVRLIINRGNMFADADEWGGAFDGRLVFVSDRGLRAQVCDG